MLWLVIDNNNVSNSVKRVQIETHVQQHRRGVAVPHQRYQRQGSNPAAKWTSASKPRLAFIQTATNQPTAHPPVLHP
ncbi:hypothetical protein CC1G_15389 [Coprinopsis cinerea okayama7|uniref:Uncharacterized protein n=1 Tax=Coprinopsis cinerea (strain Okayama-7 / 130 / ATCC MYA-4618 / FGSC 9003) TaxID=240176 RepID=D6RQR9_COPC7|nr:hypothetical protein CC1G_15389 [Coprinopsis cinerea okayama7\|eukprot:XP_002910111.1 hypothetical protein CC1G_15389 [Coprinopsis cinerea okayama7\